MSFVRPLSGLVLLAVCFAPLTVSAQMEADSFSPTEASYLGGTPFVITGSNFPTAGASPVAVRIDGLPATVIDVSSTQITGTAPAHAVTASPVDVEIIDIAQATSVTINRAVTYIGPLSVTIAEPGVVTAAVAGTEVIVTGVGFTPSSAVTVQPTTGGSFSTDTIYLDARKLRVVLPVLPTGLYQITVTDFSGSPAPFATLPDALTIVDPLELDTFDPTEVSELGETSFQLAGIGFTPDTTLEIGGVPVTPEFVSGSMLIGEVPANPGFDLGTFVPVTAIDPATGTDTIDEAFVYTGPFLVGSVTPNFVAAGLIPALQVSGIAFTESMKVAIGDEVAATTFVSPSQLTATGLTLEAGVYDVRVFSGPLDAPEHEAVLPAALTVASADPPVLESVDTSLACNEGGTHIVVYGGNFLPETVCTVDGEPLLDQSVGVDGTSLSGVVPASAGALGPANLQVFDFRGEDETDALLGYTDACAEILAPEQLEASVAYGTARFCWHNPELYDTILVLDSDGLLVDTIDGDATEYTAVLAPGQQELQLQFQGTQSSLLSAASSHLAKIFECDYPPPRTGAAAPGDLDLPIRGAHPPADVDRCSDGDGPQGPFSSIPYTQPEGATGFVTPQFVVAQQLAGSIAAQGNTLTTGFTLDQPASRLEIGAYYQKLAGDFGLALRGRLIHVFPDDGFTDEFTFPDPQIGKPKSLQKVTYYRATEDVASPTAVPCLDANGALKEIPAGDYLLEIYVVGGDPAIPYYVFADDPRDEQLLIEGSPCPPYPLVRVRDLTGFRTLPNISAIEVQNIAPQPDGTLDVTLSARGTWFDQFDNQWSIDPYCDSIQLAPTSGGGFTFACGDPPFKTAHQVEYCWSIQAFYPAKCKIDAPTSVHELPDWGCYGIDLIVRDKACGTRRSFFFEVPLIPDATQCTPGNDYFSFLFPTPDPQGVYAIAGLRNPSPGNGSFQSKRPFRARVLVTPKCFCDQTDPCAGAFVFLDTDATPPGAPSDLSDPDDDVQFRLAVAEQLGGGGVIYHDLNAEVRVQDLCPDIADGPKYFMVTVDDLGEIPVSPHLDDFVGRPVYLQGRTNCTREIDGATTVCEPVDPEDADLWWNVGGPMTMLNYPSALDSAFWTGYFDEGDQTYRFVLRGTQGTEASFTLDDTEELDFGIVDAGIPSYAGNRVNAGFTSRIAWQGGGWFSEQGLGTSSGSLLENELAAAPQVVSGSESQVSTTPFAGVSSVPAYEWCQHDPIFSTQMSQELFRSIIYAGPIGPIPVNIWGSVGLGLAIAIDSYIEFRASPFAPFSSGNFVEMQYTLVSQIDISIPCKISCDILGGIASIALGLRPDVEFDFAPYVIADLGGSSNLEVDYFLQATFALVMEATACVQTLLFGEQCLPTIEIPLIPTTAILPVNGSDPTPAACGGGTGVASSLPASAGGVVINQFEIANAPVSTTSPDGQTVVDAWVSEEVSGKLLKVCVTIQGGIPLTLGEAIPGFAWYLLDPDAVWVDNDTVIFAATGPPAGFTPDVPPNDLADPDFFDIRNANMAHTEIQIAVLRRSGPLGWELTVDAPDQISDLPGTPTGDRRADGRATIAADLTTAEALVGWVRYTGDYLIQDGFTDYYVADPSCTAPVCLAVQQPNIRPQMEATSIVVRRINEDGVIPGEPVVAISDPGINVQPSIALSPSGNVGYCAWVHDPTNVDLLTSNVGRQIHYSIYDGTTDTWSPPIPLLPFPDEYPGILEPYMVLKDDQSGILAFTALPAGAAPDDSGLGGGSRLLYACRLENGIFGPPVLLRGACQPRQYGWKQQIIFDLPILVDPFTLLEMRQPDYFMAFQEFGEVGLPAGTGNVMLSVLPQGSDAWTPAQPMLEQGTVVTNVTASLFGGALHSVHFDAGPSTPTSTFGPIVTGYKIEETALEPDAAITRCTLKDPFAGPGVVVEGEVVVENLGFYSTPYDGTSFESATGLEVVLVESDGAETIVDAFPLPVLDPMDSTTVPISVEMPHDPVRLVVRIFPNPIDRDPSNDVRECFFGAPSPTNFACTSVENTFEDGSSVVGVRLSWENAALYDDLFLYRDGSMIHALPGGCESFTDLNVGLGLHTYEVRGQIGASKSVRVALECEVAPPPPPGFAFTRGDANGDAQINIADAVYSLEYLFIAGPIFPCFAAADTNLDGQVNVADVVYLLAYSFQGGTPPPAPFPDCAPSDEESDTELGCENEGC